MNKSNSGRIFLTLIIAAFGFLSTVGAAAENQILLEGVRVEQIKDAGGKQGRPGVRIELGILEQQIDPSDKLIGVLVQREECKCRAAVGEPEHCTVAIFRRFCRVVSNNPYIEQCYWLPSHVHGTWNEKNKCCEVTVDGRKICAKDAIYQPF
jgi:hypothetical protein